MTNDEIIEKRKLLEQRHEYLFGRLSAVEQELLTLQNAVCSHKYGDGTKAITGYIAGGGECMICGKTWDRSFGQL